MVMLDQKLVIRTSSREFVPLLVYSKQFKGGVNLGTINGFNSICDSLIDYYGIKKNESFIKNLK